MVATLVLPTTIAPAARRRCTASASAVARCPVKAASPQVVGRPATSKASFNVTGMPASGPSRSPRARASSIASASLRAASARVTTTALRGGSPPGGSESMRPNTPSRAARAGTSPDAICAASVAASSNSLIISSSSLSLYRPAGTVNHMRSDRQAPTSGAARAGMSKGGLLYHFPSKSALFDALTERLRADTAANLARVESLGAVRAFLQTSCPSADEAGNYWAAFAAVHSGSTEVSPVSYTHLRAHETRHDLVCR